MIDYYWYEDQIKRGYRIGIRGVGNEIFIPMWDVIRAGDSFRLRNGRHWTDEEALQWAIKWAEKESEYVDFEEIPKEILFLNEGVSKIPGVRQNQTK